MEGIQEVDIQKKALQRMICTQEEHLQEDQEVDMEAMDQVVVLMDHQVDMEHLLPLMITMQDTQITEPTTGKLGLII